MSWCWFSGFARTIDLNGNNVTVLGIIARTSGNTKWMRLYSYNTGWCRQTGSAAAGRWPADAGPDAPFSDWRVWHAGARGSRDGWRGGV